MKDNQAPPFLGQTPKNYDPVFIDKALRNIERYLKLMGSVGPIRVSEILFQADEVASDNPNTITDYEQAGVWTPAITFATPGNLSVTYTIQVGAYTKVGNVVIARCGIQTATFTHTTASGNLTLTGLPFTPSGASYHMGACGWSGITKAGYGTVNFQPIVATTTALFSASGSAVVRSLVTAADCPTAGTIHLFGTMVYFV